MRLAKIVCTLGPSTEGVDKLCRMIEAGMDVARLNFSHGDHDSHRTAYEQVREASLRMGRPIGVLADISGPKIRLREVENGAVEIVRDANIVLTPEDCVGNAERVSVNYPTLAEDVRVGESVFIDDGLLELVVQEVRGTDVHCSIVAGGVLRSRKGLNFPHACLSAPAVTPKDKKDIEFACELGVDFFAMSFVRHPDDVRQAKMLAGDIPVIAKIEKPQAIEFLEGIADAADGCMVARGDLGIEVGQHKVPMLQKRIIQEMNRRAKPVITATQMLESMVSSPQPTRAEVSDVANAVLDGSDALMLSAESAVGKFPDRAVQTMARIIEEVQLPGGPGSDMKPDPFMGPPTVRNAVARAAAQSVIELGLRAMAVYTDSGHGVRLVSAQRPTAVVLGLCHNEDILRRLTLTWGVRPVLVPRPTHLDQALKAVERIMLQQQLATPGSHVAIAFTFGQKYDVRLTSGVLIVKIGVAATHG